MSEDKSVCAFCGHKLRVRRAPGGHKFNQAKLFLEDQLRDGPVSVRVLADNAAVLGMGLPMLNRVKRSLGVISTKSAGRCCWWVWRLPDADVTAKASTL